MEKQQIHKRKPFLITIDTEGDNLWTLDIEKEKIKTKNLFYLRRFQQLCEKFNFIPTYLVNFEAVNDDNFVNFFKNKLINQKCEIGIHLHAWNNPPLYNLKKRSDGIASDKPYLIEYPESVMKNKFNLLYDLIVEKFGIKPIVHRAGRWAMNDIYMKILDEKKVLFDCSFTPGLDWKQCAGYTDKSCGTDYTNVPNKMFKYKNTNVIEIPLTTFKKYDKYQNLKIKIKKFINHNYSEPIKTIIMRPNASNLNDLLYLAKISRKKDYLMFMLHSSEMMPGGSPNFVDEKSIENLFFNLNFLFSHIANYYYGSSFKDFYAHILKTKKRLKELVLHSKI